MRIISEKMKVIHSLVLVAIVLIKCKISVASHQYPNEHNLENLHQPNEDYDPSIHVSYDKSFEPIIISNERLSDAQHQVSSEHILILIARHTLL